VVSFRASVPQHWEESVAKQFNRIEPAHAAFINQQKIFFTASAAATGRVNISPREIGALRVLDPNTVAYLDQTGSGNETAAHLRASGRLTIMFCGFENVPVILRLYGQGRALPRGTPEYAALLASAYDNNEPLGARQIIRLAVEMVQTSCGYGVPLFDYKEERPTLRRWAETNGEDGLAAYRREKNVRSIDGFDTGVASQIDGFDTGVAADQQLALTD
jgi:Pyridoxamine 5'-phosphate oxidase